MDLKALQNPTRTPGNELTRFRSLQGSLRVSETLGSVDMDMGLKACLSETAPRPDCFRDAIRQSQHKTAYRYWYCPTTANRGGNWYQSIDNCKLSGRPFYFFHFKGTPSQAEHKTILSVFTTIESASTG